MIRGERQVTDRVVDFDKAKQKPVGVKRLGVSSPCNKHLRITVPRRLAKKE